MNRWFPFAPVRHLPLDPLKFGLPQSSWLDSSGLLVSGVGVPNSLLGEVLNVYGPRPPRVHGSQVHGAACTLAHGHQLHSPPSLLAKFLIPRLRCASPGGLKFSYS